MQFKKCEAIESIAVKLTKERLLWFLKKARATSLSKTA